MKQFILNHKYLTLSLLLLNGIFSGAGALDITVEATNKTTGQKAAAAERVSVISLTQTMQTLAAKTDVALPVRFTGLEAMAGSPYMIQVSFQGVNYNKVIPPNTPGDSITVAIDVYNTSANFGQNLQFETFIEVHYVNDVLATDITYHFINAGRMTLTERGAKKGVLVYIPGGKNIEAIATLDSLHGSSDIKTIKLSPTELPDRAGYYFLDQPIKPGEKYYQTRAHYRYKGEPLEIEFENIYPLTTQPSIVIHPKNMKVFQKGNPDTELKTEYNETMGANYVTIPKTPGKFTLVFSGGDPEAVPEEAAANTGRKSGKPVSVSSVLGKEVKIAGIAVFMIVVVAAFFYIRSRPAWMQVMQAKNLGRLEFELQNLKKLNLPEMVKSEKEARLVAKIQTLKKSLGG